MKLKFRSKFNHGFTNHGYLHSAIWKAFHNFETKRAQEARHNHFFYQNVKNNEIFEIFKMLALFSTGNTFFWVNLVQKLKIVSLSSNFVSRLIKIYTFPWWCSLFLFSTGNTFLGKFGSKNQNCQFELKFRTRLIWICKIKQKNDCVRFFCFIPAKTFLDKSGQKLSVEAEMWYQEMN